MGEHGTALDVGELAFVVVREALSVLGVDDVPAPVINFEAFAKVIGAIECAKMELYRRLVVPYEERKIAQNGDVPGLEPEPRRIE